MEVAPPSYEVATKNDVWQLVAPHLTSAQLCQASLVSKQWHQAFAGRLWAVPTSHFGLEYNGVLDHLARFQKTLDFARFSTRSFTYCLHLTPSQALYFDDRPSEWLRRLLELLPNLQALLVPGVSYFDHAASQALRTSDSIPLTTSKASRASNNALYELRLLDASNCINLTSTSLTTALGQLTSLVYLDLSHSHAAKDKLVYQTIAHLYALKVLKLRATRLTDEDVLSLAGAIGWRVCSLDLRDNNFTDRSVDVLIELCFQTRTAHSNTRDEHLDTQIYHAYTTATVNRLTIEDVAERGITSLKVSGNDLSETSLSKLMSQSALYYLDIGRLKAAAVPQLMLNQGVGCALTLLRLDHRVIRTGTAGLYLQPDLLPRVTILTLAGVPAYSMDQQTASGLIDFLKACAGEARNAMSLAVSDYISPPGQHGRAVTVQRSAAKIFALQTIVLEMATNKRSDDIAASTTGDKDSEAMWAAGESDFSFFREEEVTNAGAKLADFTFTKPKVDNIALISAFRNDRKLAYQRALQNGQVSADVPGYWPGVVQVQRSTKE